MSRIKESQKYNSIPDNKNAEPKIYKNIISHKCSFSFDITFNPEEQTIITKKYKKFKVILKRPEQDKTVLHSVSPKKNTNKNLTYQKSPIKDKNIVYNKKLNSEKNNMNIINKNKYKIKPKNMNLSSFKITKNKNINYNDIFNKILDVMDKILYKHEKLFFHNLKYYNKNNTIYHKKTINDNKNMSKINCSLPLPILPNNKNFLEEINLKDKTIIYNNCTNNKSQTEDDYTYDNDSCDKNLTIISKPEIKKLDSSNSNEISEKQDNNINSENELGPNRNYSYDKKDNIDNKDNSLFNEIKEELDNNLQDKEVISNKRNKIKKESLLFSEGISNTNKNESDKKINQNEEKENNNSKKIKNLKQNSSQFTTNIDSNDKKRKSFIDNISFEKIELNKLLENSNNKTKSKKISYSKYNSNSISNTNNSNNNTSNIKNKNLKEFNENTFNTAEETTHFLDNENNPINKITYEDEKNIFNTNSDIKNEKFDVINKKELNNFNSNSIIKQNENIIEKSGELFYPVDDLTEPLNPNINFNNDKKDLNNNEEDDEIEINDKNKLYMKYKVVDKSKKIISFFSNPKENNKNNQNNNESFNAKIPLDSYFNIINKILPKKNSSTDNINNNNKSKVLENKNNNNQMSFSIKAYESFIKQMIDEINLVNTNDNLINNYEIFDKDIYDLENKVKNLKYCVLYLLVKKHYLKSKDDKLKLISENNNKIEKHKKEIYDLYQKLKKVAKNDDIQNILNILKKYETISKREIKIMKMNYQNVKTEDKRLLNYGSLIIPFFYIAKFLNTFQV